MKNSFKNNFSNFKINFEKVLKQKDKIINKSMN